MKRIPSLDSLRAFEAAARHLSFTKAGSELHVTQSALSHRINALERELGMPLFRRLTRSLALTPEGEQLAAGMQRALAEITRTLAAIDPAQSARPLRVNILPSFATRWMVPRLPRFQRACPDVEVRIIADSTLVDLRTDGADLAIRFGLGGYPGLHVVHLMPDAVFPVCSPRLAAEIGPIDHPSRITAFPLLYDSAAESDDSGSNWRSWLMHVGQPDALRKDGLHFNQAALMLEAALNGLGLGLARKSLVADDLVAGRLVRVLPHEAPTAFSYYLVCMPAVAERPSVAKFCAWLLEEARAFSSMDTPPVPPKIRRRPVASPASARAR